jgi:hypothetical protein
MSRRMRLERRHPCLHEWKHEKALSDRETERFDAAEATALQAGCLRSSPLAS